MTPHRRAPPSGLHVSVVWPAGGLPLVDFRSSIPEEVRRAFDSAGDSGRRRHRDDRRWGRRPSPVASIDNVRFSKQGGVSGRRGEVEHLRDKIMGDPSEMVQTCKEMGASEKLHIIARTLACLTDHK